MEYSNRSNLWIFLISAQCAWRPKRLKRRQGSQLILRIEFTKFFRIVMQPVIPTPPSVTMSTNLELARFFGYARPDCGVDLDRSMASRGGSSVRAAQIGKSQMLFNILRSG